MKKAREIASSKDGKRIICIDIDHWEVIYEYITQDDRHKKKFKYISDVILDGHRNTDVYDKENINEKCKNITAMKFFKRADNDRVYCKEVKDEDKTLIIIACRLYKSKKTKKVNKKIIPILESIAKTNYEIIRKQN